MNKKPSLFAPMTLLHTPVLFLIFNRPDTTACVFDMIRQAKPPRLYIASDGPRESRAGESLRVRETRDFVLQSISWDCEVKTLFRENNLGCKIAVSSAITWFFEQEEMGIILEDDTVPSLNFFWFCEELLEKYKDDLRVLHVDGTSFSQVLPISESYDFSKYALIWGWATWRRAWKSYDVKMGTFREFLSGKMIERVWDTRAEQEFWTRLLSLAYEDKVDTWDFQWFYTIWSMNGLTIRPRINMVKNIGFSQEATHTKKSSRMFDDMLAMHYEEPLTHPKFVLQNKTMDRNCSFVRFGITSNFLWRVYRKILGLLKV
ncbi:MAG: nucleotide-diphospho-sugar transferase [Candidatus Ozemobacteraceae bacterium]